MPPYFRIAFLSFSTRVTPLSLSLSLEFVLLFDARGHDIRAIRARGRDMARAAPRSRASILHPNTSECTAVFKCEKFTLISILHL